MELSFSPPKIICTFSLKNLVDTRLWNFEKEKTGRLALEQGGRDKAKKLGTNNK
jgi:hypothetical protein